MRISGFLVRLSWPCFSQFSDHFPTIFYSRFLWTEFTKVLIFLEWNFSALSFLVAKRQASFAMDVIVRKPISPSSPAVRVDARSDLNKLIESQAGYKFVKGMILERRRLKHLKNNYASTNTTTADLNSRAPPNPGMHGEVSSRDINSLKFSSQNEQSGGDGESNSNYIFVRTTFPSSFQRAYACLCAI